MRVIEILILVVILSYAFGSIPFGWLIARSKGIEIRQHGSGNIGATNVLRVIGKPWGITVFILDALKGFLAVEAAMWLATRSPTARPLTDVLAIVAAAMAVIGHSFPVWLGFNGGKGVATSAGALIAVVPLAALIALVVWVLAFYSTRYVSLASILGALAVPITVGVLAFTHRAYGLVLLCFCSAMAALVIWRHRSNISRLLAGREEPFSRK